MFGIGKLKFKGVDKKTIDDQAHIDDYTSAEEIGRVRLGRLCLFRLCPGSAFRPVPGRNASEQCAAGKQNERKHQ